MKHFLEKRLHDAFGKSILPDWRQVRILGKPGWTKFYRTRYGRTPKRCAIGLHKISVREDIWKQDGGAQAFICLACMDALPTETLESWANQPHSEQTAPADERMKDAI